MTNKRITELNLRNEILHRCKLGEKYIDIGRSLGVSKSHVSAVCRKYGNLYRAKKRKETEVKG